jgi:GxxExxY protein
MRGEGSLPLAHLTETVVGAFGFPESIYSNALAVELDRRGLRVAREVPIEVVFDGVQVGRFRLDMVVEGLILVELKATAALSDGDTRQLLSYLKATDIEVGLLLHFGPSATFKRFVYSNERKTPSAH